VPIIRNLDQLPATARGGAVAIGNFDGVHRGHVRIVKQLQERARAVGGPAVVFTFDPHPVRILRPDQCPPPLTWTTRKAELLAQQGVDRIVAYPTDQQLLELSARQFFQQIVCDALEARAMVEGPNFYFGHRREGDIELLRQLTAQNELTLDVVEPYAWAGQWVSSSRIRAAIVSGEVDQAAQMLSSPYRIRGMVTHGAGRGAKLGFPTANLEAVDTLLPKMGVYAGLAWCVGAASSEEESGYSSLDTKKCSPHRREGYLAAISLGPNPTFADRLPKVEIHLIDCNQNLYGQPLEVEFHLRLRGIEKFDSQAALVEQLHQDVRRTRKVVGTNP
jgi:riboflavin kinase/FMN adenylyltransferase